MLMAEIVPTITAYDLDTYHQQIGLVRSFAKRIHIDLMDGEFAPTKSPPLKDVWWPKELRADLHLMYQRPMDFVDTISHMDPLPELVIVHNEAEVHHMHLAAELHKADIAVGLAILQDTPVDWIEQIMHSFDHILIFSGNLGHHGGAADLRLLEKVDYIQQHHPEVEIGWDGGIQVDNAAKLAQHGVSVLNVGGGIHASDNPNEAYATLRRSINER